MAETEKTRREKVVTVLEDVAVFIGVGTILLGGVFILRSDGPFAGYNVCPLAGLAYYNGQSYFTL